MDASPSKLRPKDSPVRSPPSVRSFGKKKSTEEESTSQLLKREGVALLDPKVFESHEPIPGKVPRKVVIDRKRKQFAALNIEDLLKKEGLDLAQPQTAWLPLEPFDDYDLETRTAQEWIAFAGETGDSVPALALFRDQSGPATARWRPALVVNWDPERRRFTGIWDDSQKGAFVLPKISVLFHSEDPSRFSTRLLSAYLRRKYAENLIRYNFYIDNMPMEEVPTLTSPEKQKLLHKATASLGLQHSYAQENSSIVVEVANGYSRVMNKIIFDKHFAESPKELLATNLELPPAPGKQPAPQYALVQIQPHNYKLQFNDFCLTSLNIRGETIDTTEKGQNCSEVRKRSRFPHVFRKDDEVGGLFESGTLSQISS